MSQVQKKRKISQDEAFFEDDWLEAHPEVELENIKVLQKAEYQPDQTMSDYSPEDLAMSSAIEGFQPMKYSFLGNRAEEISCPPATQDSALNRKNQQSTIENHEYGPMDVANPGNYWEKMAKLWKKSVEEAKNQNCGNCVAYDVSPRMKECGVGENLGYCWMHNFKCQSARTCNTWATGGPIETDKESQEWQERAFGGITKEAEMDSKEKARLKKYEKTYGKEGAKVRNRIFKRILAKAQDGTKAGQWSARKAQSLTEDYEKAMSGKGKKPYKSSKRTKSQKSLKKWGDQDWRTKSGKKSSKTGERYLPAKAIKALTDEEYKKTSAKKRKDMKKGKQFSDQPKSIAKKVKKYRAESSKPHSVTISRSSNPQKKLMAVFEDSEGKKMKTTHFGQRGASDYTKHGDKERMERYLERHGGGFETSTKEDWKDPTTAGSLSRWILWNKPGLKSSFDDYKRRFGLKGEITVSKSAEAVLGKSQNNTHAVAVLVPDPKEKVEGVVRFTQDGNTLHVDYDIENLDDGEHGFHVHEYGDLTEGCKSACAHFNPHSEEHGGLDSKTRHLGDLGNIISKNGVSKGRISTNSISLNMGLPNCIVGRMIIVHKDRDDLGKGGDAESLLTGNAGERLGCGVIGLSEGKDFESEDWEDTDWETHAPSNDPSPFETIEWTRLPPPPQNIKRLMEAFNREGYTILVVGGAVRDLLLGLEPKDYDLATNAKPAQVKEVVDGLEGYRYVLGPQAEKSVLNLTSLVTIPDEKEAIEITTFRKELGYAGDRTKGQFIPAFTFDEDSARRDLTINSMGMTVDGIVIDPQDGLKDMQNGVIRAVGDPTQRFVEDPLRMIRAIRFSVRFGLPIEDDTYDAIVENADLVTTLSGRRLRDEIGKVIIQPNGYKLLMETGILPTLMPQFRNMEQYHHKLDYHPEDTLYNHYIEVFKKFTTIPNRTELGAWALLFHDIAKPQTAEWNEEGGYHTFYGHDKQGSQLILENYNNESGPFEFSKKELQAIAWVADHHLGKFWDMKKPMKVSAMRNNENWPLLVQVITGDIMENRRGGDEQLKQRLIEIDEITDKVNAQKAKTGNRPPGFAQLVIQQLNVQGKQISEALSEIEEIVSTGQAQSYDEALEVLKTKRNA